MLTESDQELLMGEDVQQIVRHWARHYSRRKGLEYDDAYQWGMYFAIDYFVERPGRARDRGFLFGLYYTVRARVHEILAGASKRRDSVRTVGENLWIFPREDRRGSDLEVSWVREAMALLPEHQRQVIDLVHLQGMNPSEAGRHLGVTGQTVRNRLGDAEPNLRRALRTGTARPQDLGPGWKRFAPRDGADVFKKVRPIARPCSGVGCENAAESRGYCSTHYARWRKHGDPEVMLKRWQRH